jgi:ABC-type enterochelin transport system permease subunit
LWQLEEVAVNSVTGAVPLGSTVSRGATLKRLFVIGYLTAVAVAMIGWVSAFGWLTVQVAKWLLA